MQDHIECKRYEFLFLQIGFRVEWYMQSSKVSQRVHTGKAPIVP